MSFLNRTNFEHVLGIATQYLQDSNTMFVTQDELQKMVADTMLSIKNAKDTNKESLDIEKWNRLTILTVRDAVRQKKPMASDAADSELADPFFVKLQELEASRKAGNVWMQTDATASGTTSPPTAPASLAAPVTTTNAVPSVTTIYMQAPPEKGTAIHIRSWHRSWLQSPMRAVFPWQGPYPVGIDTNTLYVSTLVVPKQTLLWTPYVILEMEGAGGQVNECIMVPDTKSASITWEYLRPCSRSIGYIRPLALPWKIRVLDADRELLPLGQDHWKVKDIQRIREISRLTVVYDRGDTSLSKDFATNEVLLLTTTNGSEVRCKIVAVGANTVDVDETIDMKFVNAHILHLHRQSSLILETTQTAHTKK